MKKTTYLVATLIGVSTLFSSCAVGSWSAMNWCFNLNNTITGNKFVNAIIAFILSPFEFAIGGFCDSIIFNTIEFWSGSNPVAATTVVKGQDGNLYAIAPIKNGGYRITNKTTDQSMNLLFEKDTHTWSVDVNGKVSKLITLVDQNNAIIYLQDGSTKAITLDEAGLTACHNLMSNQDMAMK